RGQTNMWMRPNVDACARRKQHRAHVFQKNKRDHDAAAAVRQDSSYRKSADVAGATLRDLLDRAHAAIYVAASTVSTQRGWPAHNPAHRRPRPRVPAPRATPSADRPWLRVRWR